MKTNRQNEREGEAYEKINRCGVARLRIFFFISLFFFSPFRLVYIHNVCRSYTLHYNVLVLLIFLSWLRTIIM